MSWACALKGGTELGSRSSMFAELHGASEAAAVVRDWCQGLYSAADGTVHNLRTR